jgi:hypothetical protein
MRNQAGPRRANPYLGATVIYRSRTGTYQCPAMVTAVADSLNPDGVEAGAVPALSDDFHAHLVVFTPGIPGASIPGVEAPAGAQPNQGGSYPEWDIPFDPSGETPGSWAWPAVVG